MNKEVFEKLRALKPKLERDYALKRLRLFGSHARDDFRPDSDVDLIVDFSQTPTLFDLAGMQSLIEENLQKDVDFVFEKKIFSRLRDSILEDAIDV